MKIDGFNFDILATIPTAGYSIVEIDRDGATSIEPIPVIAFMVTQVVDDEDHSITVRPVTYDGVLHPLHDQDTFRGEYALVYPNGSVLDTNFNAYDSVAKWTAAMEKRTAAKAEARHA